MTKRIERRGMGEQVESMVVIWQSNVNLRV